MLDLAAHVFNVPPASLTLETAYGACAAWDSIMHIRLVMEFGAVWGVEIPFESIARIKTLRDFLQFVPTA